MTHGPIRTQAVRYLAVGVASNLVLYLLYLLFTWAGVGHKSAMTGLYLLGVLQTFVFNRSWSFQHTGHAPSALLRYTFAYAGGYLLNLAMLLLLVDRWGLPHQPVQGAMILLLAGILFLLQRYWVFPPVSRAGSSPGDMRGKGPASRRLPLAYGKRLISITATRLTGESLPTRPHPPEH